MTSESTITRRAHERVRLSLEVAYRSTGSFLISYTVDLSRGGLFVHTADPGPVGSSLELRIAIPGVDEEVRLTIRFMGDADDVLLTGPTEKEKFTIFMRGIRVAIVQEVYRMTTRRPRSWPELKRYVLMVNDLTAATYGVDPMMDKVRTTSAEQVCVLNADKSDRSARTVSC